MSTRALIIGKDSKGLFYYGQSKFDGDRNLEWLQRNMTDPAKVDEFLYYLADHGIVSLSYKRVGSFLDFRYDLEKPLIEWYEDSYNCGVAGSKEAVLKMIGEDMFDAPEYISYWDGKSWRDIDKYC